MDMKDVDELVKNSLRLRGGLHEDSNEFHDTFDEITDAVEQHGKAEYDRGYDSGEDAGGNEYSETTHYDLDDSPDEVRLLARAIRMGDRAEAKYQLDKLVSGAEAAKYQVYLGWYDRDARLALTSSTDNQQVAA